MRQHENDAKLKWTAKHIPVSSSMSSNVPGYTNAECIIDREPDTIFSKLYFYMNKVRTVSSELKKKELAGVISQIQEQMELWKPDIIDNENKSDIENVSECIDSNICEPPSKRFLNAIAKPNVYAEFQNRLDKGEFSIQYNDWDESENEESSECESESENVTNEHHVNLNIPTSIDNVANESKKIMYQHYKRLLLRVESYCEILPVLTFNGKSYDLVLSREYLPTYFKLHGKNVFTVKKK